LATEVPPPILAGRDFPLGEPGFTYQDLHRDERLADLDRAFLQRLERDEPDLAERLRRYRADPKSLDPLALSRLLVDAARPLGRFVARLFGIEEEWRRQAAPALRDAVLFRCPRGAPRCRRLVVDRTAIHGKNLAENEGRVAASEKGNATDEVLSCKARRAGQCRGDRIRCADRSSSCYC